MKKVLLAGVAALALMATAHATDRFQCSGNSCTVTAQDFPPRVKPVQVVQPPVTNTNDTPLTEQEKQETVDRMIEAISNKTKVVQAYTICKRNVGVQGITLEQCKELYAPMLALHGLEPW